MLKDRIIKMLNCLRIRRCTKAQKQVEQWMIECKRLLIQLEKDRRDVINFCGEFAEVSESYKQRIDKSDQLLRQHETVLESLRSENTVLGVEITALTTANQLVLERYRADTAIQTAKQIALRTKED